MLSLSGVAADPALADAVVQGIARGGNALLPADLQIAAMAMRELRISSLAALHEAGGADRARVRCGCTTRVARPATSAPALRLCAELAVVARRRARPTHVIRRITLEPGFASSAFATLESAAA